MRRQKNNFFATKKEGKVWYDLFEDWGLIEASFAQQYGIRLRREELQWSEFTALLSGLNEKTPLGKIVAIRSETDGEMLKHFSKEQRKIRNDWLVRLAKKRAEENPESVRSEIMEIQNIFKQAFGGGK